MCNSCGCGSNSAAQTLATEQHAESVMQKRQTVATVEHLLNDNDRQATHNRQYFDQHRILVINLMSAPGSGKTTLLEATIVALKDTLRLAVIEGDLETENDADRIRAHGVPAVQITTGSACHLDARMVRDALYELDLHGLDILFIENVGNLICPASFDLGQHANVILLSVTEGDDKPAKYPVMCRAADLLLISKVDLLSVIDDFDPALCENHLRNLANTAPVFRLSARTGLGLEDWLGWLRQTLHDHRSLALARK